MHKVAILGAGYMGSAITFTKDFVILNGRVQRISQAAEKLFKEKWFVLELRDLVKTFGE